MKIMILKGGPMKDFVIYFQYLEKQMKCQAKIITILINLPDDLND